MNTLQLYYYMTTFTPANNKKGVEADLFFLGKYLEKTLELLLTNRLGISVDDQLHDLRVGKFELLEEDVHVHTAFHIQ